MHERKFRMWDPFNEVMSYSDKYKNLGSFFNYYQALVSGDNNPKLMDWIGLHDKNKSDIYESDILEIGMNRTDRGDSYTYIAEVFWHEDDLCWGIKSEEHGIEHISWVLDGFHGEYQKTIGNVWQDPHLLKKSNA